MKTAVHDCETGKVEIRDLTPEEEKERTDGWAAEKPLTKRERLDALLAREGLTLDDFKAELEAAIKPL